MKGWSSIRIQLHNDNPGKEFRINEIPPSGTCWDDHVFGDFVVRIDTE